MAGHTIDALAGLGEHQFLNALLADLAVEAMGMVRIVAGHDRLVEDGLAADVATVRAVRTHRGAVREKQQIRVGRHLLVAFCAFEAINVEV